MPSPELANEGFDFIVELRGAGEPYQDEVNRVEGLPGFRHATWFEEEEGTRTVGIRLAADEGVEANSMVATLAELLEPSLVSDNGAPIQSVSVKKAPIGEDGTSTLLSLDPTSGDLRRVSPDQALEAKTELDYPDTLKPLVTDYFSKVYRPPEAGRTDEEMGEIKLALEDARVALITAVAKQLLKLPDEQRGEFLAEALGIIEKLHNKAFQMSELGNYQKQKLTLAITLRAIRIAQEERTTEHE